MKHTTIKRVLPCRRPGSSIQVSWATRVLPMLPPVRVHLTRHSKNAKTAEIPVSTTGDDSCPPDCPLKGFGCYAETGKTAFHWHKVSSGERGITWPEFLAAIAGLPALQPWRHNQAGDLPHTGGRLRARLVMGLATANRGKRGWTYTHHRLTPGNLLVIKAAIRAGFTINASTESAEAAARMMAEHGIPAVAVVPSTETRRTWTTECGTRVVQCPAIWNNGVSCGGGMAGDKSDRRMTVSCGGSKGPLCQRADRDYVVAFPAHGIQKGKVDTVLHS